MTDADRLFEDAAGSGRGAYAKWMSHVERPLRASLKRFARAIDVECAMQETFMRMWIARRDPERKWVGDDASLRFALRVARNVALEDVRRAKLGHLVPLDELDAEQEPSIPAVPARDPKWMASIRECVEQLKGRPREVMGLRLSAGGMGSDRELATTLGMAVNTFLQNVVRARKAVAACLEAKGL